MCVRKGLHIYEKLKTQAKLHHGLGYKFRTVPHELNRNSGNYTAEFESRLNTILSYSGHGLLLQWIAARSESDGEPYSASFEPGTMPYFECFSSTFAASCESAHRIACFDMKP